MFGSRFRGSRVLRESVEIVAIVLAGLWSLYVFVYENRIKPALAPPTPSIAIGMRHVGNDGNLAVIRLDETIRNTGIVTFYFLGYSVTVIGSRVVGLSSPQPAAVHPPKNELEAYNRYTGQRPVFRDAYVTDQGNGGAGPGLFVEPGQTSTLSREFYVPRGRFDRLTAWVVAVCTTDRSMIATKMRIKPNGVPSFETAPSARIYQTAAPISELDLKAE